MKLVEKISIKILPMLQDNYVPLLHEKAVKHYAVIDPAAPDEILRQIAQTNGQLTHIFLTHHHHDHIGGVAALVEATGAKVVGHAADAHRLPSLDIAVQEGDELQWQGVSLKVMFLPGHTSGHIAYYAPQLNSLFCGDVLFLMGCGRLFEGTPQQMFDSLARIKNLPEHTRIYCAHEYTQKNGEFALSVDAQNSALQQRMQQVRDIRAKGEPTVPGVLEEELATNPFLRAPDVEAFAKLRKARNHF